MSSRKGVQLLLERLRIIISALKKSDLFKSSVTDEGLILSELKSAQAQLRIFQPDKIEPWTFLKPLLKILTSASVAGPFKLTVLESLHNIVINSDVLQCCDRGCLEAILESLTGFKFIETEAKLDEKVNLQLMRTIFGFVHNVDGLVYFLSLRPLMVFLFQIIGQPGIAKRDVERYRTAVEILKLIVTKLVDEVATDNFVLSSSDNVFICLFQLLSNMQDVFGTYLKHLYRYESTLDNKDKTPENEPNAYLAEKNGLRTSLHLFQHIWRLFGDRPSAYWKLTRDQEMGQVLNLELGYSIISLASRLHLLDTITSQHIINVFVTMVNSEGCANRFMVESFLRQVFLKYLHAAWGLVSNFVRDDFSLVELLCPADNIPSFAATLEVELLEYLVDSLCDLFSSVSFLPSIYATFDCNPTAPDIAYTLIKYISSLSSIVIAVGAENLGDYKELGIEVMLCTKQLLLSMQSRATLADTWRESQIAGSPLLINSDYMKTLSDVAAYSRENKVKFYEACSKFTEDADVCFLELQKLGLLSKPLRAVDVANFLRNVGHLNKEAIGAYIGALGKESSKEWCTVSFHQEVLLKYVDTFNLQGQTALGALRVFLSAFRLPGEAQQIDRILVAFSEHCHKYCRESRDGLLENAEVTYLLMFSIIMLNTDRHNPNIKPERKMTMEQFIRTNTNYGKDVNQTRPIPREYLVNLYEEISNSPLRTEPNNTFSIITREEWTDMCLRAEISPALRLLVSPSYQLSGLFTDVGAVDADADPIISLSFPAVILPQQEGLTNEVLLDVALGLPESENSIPSSSDAQSLQINLRLINGMYWLWDEDIMHCMWQQLLLPGLALTLSQVLPYPGDDTVGGSSSAGTSGSASSNTSGSTVRRSKRTLKQRHEFSTTYMKEFINLAMKTKLDNVLDVVMAVLLESTGVLEANISNHLLEGDIDLGLEMNFKLGDDAYDCEFHLNLVDCLAFPSAKSAMLNLLDLISTYTSKIRHWEIVLFVLALLRDFHLLPADMVTDSEADILPATVREEFDQFLHKLHRKINPASNVTDLTKKIPRITSETSSALQILGNALFGSSEPLEPEENQDKMKSPLDPEVIRSFYEDKLNSATSRWDANFFTLLSSVTYQVPSSSKAGSTNSSGTDGGMTTVPLYDTAFIAKVADTISTIVPETKFLSDASLCELVHSIIRVSETVQVLMTPEAASAGGSVASNDEDGYDLPPVSAASAAWLETVLVEIALRNRDRLLLIWPLLRKHYLRCLTQRTCETNYVTDRRICGLLKLIARLLSRDHYAGILIELLGQVLLANEPTVSETIERLTSASMDALDEDSQFMQRQRAAKSANVGFSFSEFSGQIAAGMFRILTQNVDLLPYLSIEQWETIFLVVAKCSSAGTFASFKSFETLAWLLHEPRLIASVPVFCVVAIQPLVTNTQAQSFVSLGAVSLLKYLHARMESLVSDSTLAGGVSAAGSTVGDDLDLDHSNLDGGIWKKCWFPVLQALANGVADERENVRNGAAQTLFETVCDAHMRSVPTALVIDILTNMIVPAAHVLEDYMVAEWNKVILRASAHGNSTAANSSVLRSSSGVVGSNNSRNNRGSSGASNRAVLAAVEESSWVAVDPQDSSDVASLASGETGTSASVPTVSTNKSILEQCLDTLSLCVLDNFSRLSKYPSFDKLWLRTIQCLIHFTECPTAFEATLAGGNGGSASVDSSGQESRLSTLLKISATSTQQLRLLLQAALQHKVFQNRQGLKSVTAEFIRQTKYALPLLELVDPAGPIGSDVVSP